MSGTTGSTAGAGGSGEADGGWTDWISPGPGAAFGVAGMAVEAVLDAVRGGDDDPDGGEVGVGAVLGTDRQYSDEELDVDHDGDVDQDDVTQQTTENLWTGIQTGNLIMSSEAAGQAQLDAIDAIYGND